MHRSLIAGLLFAVTASLASPAFASGYGPAPFYRPDTGAPASQRGPGDHSFFSRHRKIDAANGTDAGGVETYGTQSGTERTSPDRQ
nr:hypothetical protein [Paraburkholderia sp. BCC1884]